MDTSVICLNDLICSLCSVNFATHTQHVCPQFYFYPETNLIFCDSCYKLLDTNDILYLIHTTPCMFCPKGGQIAFYETTQPQYPLYNFCIQHYKDFIDVNRNQLDDVNYFSYHQNYYELDITLTS